MGFLLIGYWEIFTYLFFKNKKTNKYLPEPWLFLKNIFLNVLEFTVKNIQ